MADQTANILNLIISKLKDKALSISEISESAKINWRTAEHNLNILRKLNIVEERNIKNRRTFFYKEKDNYFDLPVKNEDIKKINTIYHHIKETCQRTYLQEPTKTQIYKILWKVNKKLKWNLPIGWYMYGPLCIQKFHGDENKEMDLKAEEIQVIELITIESCKHDNLTLQKEVYEEAKEELYLTKEELINKKYTLNEKDFKKEINPVLMSLIKHTPEETEDVVTDFARATLLLGIRKTMPCFQEAIWKYITLVRFRDSLKEYNPHVEIYLNIKEAKKEAQLRIKYLVESKAK